MGFYTELNSEKSDRAAALVGAAFLDVRLEELLASFFIDNKEIFQQVLDPENPQSIIGSFGARITISYGLGLISKEECDDLRIIKNIRNRFAHGLHGLSFSDDWIHDASLKLVTSDFDYISGLKENPRNRFLTAVSLLSAGLEMRRLAAKREQREPKKAFERMRTLPEE